MRVFVYFNLHKHVWSIKALEGEHKGRVIAHAKDVYLKDARPRVSEAGRQRVLREKRKNVHAGIIGELTGYKPWTSIMDREDITKTQLYYNPYKVKTFVDKTDHGKRFETAELAHLGVAPQGYTEVSVVRAQFA